MEAEFLEKALETGKALGAAQSVDGLLPYAVVPPDYSLLSLEHLQKTPTRIKQTVSVLDPASFIKYYTDFNDEHSRVFVDGLNQKIVGVIDYHVSKYDENGARWGDHRVSYAFRPTPEWKTWTESNRKTFNQSQFAQFIEDNLPDIVEPTQAHISEVSRTLEVKKAVNFSSDTRLDNGQVQFTYEEEVRGTASRGTLEIPQHFTLALAPFQGSPNYRVTARLRYRLKENKLEIWYELVRPHKIIEDAVNEVVGTIRAGVNEGTLLYGSI